MTSSQVDGNTAIESLDEQQRGSTARSRIQKTDLFKFVGLILFLLLLTYAVLSAMPLFSELTRPGGVDRVIEEVQNAGALGVLTLFAMQFIQIVIALIPGEIIQVAAGMMYGPWLGALIIVAGCVVSSAFIYLLISKLGRPFAQAMISPKWMAKLRDFEDTDHLNTMVFVLFLIPGLPKDIFSYLVPLTDMSLRSFVIISNTARLPGIFLSTYAANSFIDGDYLESVLLFIACAVVAVLAVLFSEHLIRFFRKRQNK